MTVCAIFHIFKTEELQLTLARALGALLSPEPGSMIMGRHSELPEKGVYESPVFPMFCHSPESWKEMWENEVLEKGAVEVRAELQPLDAPPGVVPTGLQFWQLVWSVTRV